MLDALRQQNPNFIIQSVHDSSFLRYGRILPSQHYRELFDYLEKKTDIPSSGNTYIAHDPRMESLVSSHHACSHVFGGLRLEYGYVNGQNKLLNALEYHKSSEINLALSPLVLILARVEDMKKNTIRTDQVEIYYIPAKTAIEIYPFTLHFSPCKVVSSGFKCGVILPYGTNMDFITLEEAQSAEDDILFKTNKWIVIHDEHQKFKDLGAKVGIIGQNIEINGI